MRGIKAKEARRARARDVERLQTAVNENADLAMRYWEAGLDAQWRRFWANVEIAALLQYGAHAHAGVRCRYETTDLEKAVTCWPAEVSI